MFLFTIYRLFFFLYFHFNPHTILLREDIYLFSKSFLFLFLLLPFSGVCSKKRFISSVYIYEEVLQALRAAAFANRSYTRILPIREQICFHIPHLSTLNAEFPVRCNRTLVSLQAEITKHQFNVWFGRMSLKTGLTSHRELDTPLGGRRGSAQEHHYPTLQTHPATLRKPRCAAWFCHNKWD